MTDEIDGDVAPENSPENSTVEIRNVTEMSDPVLSPIEKARLALREKLDSGDPEFEARRKRRMTIAEYEEAKLLRQRDGLSIRVIAERFQINPGNLRIRFNRDGIVKGEFAHIHRKAIERRSVERAAQRADEIVSFLMTNEEICSKGITMLDRHILALFNEAVKSGRPMGQYMQDIRACKEAIMALKMGQDTGRSIMDHYDNQNENSLPELPVMVMDEQAVAELRRQEDQERALMGVSQDDEDDEDYDDEDYDDDVVIEES